MRRQTIDPPIWFKPERYAGLGTGLTRKNLGLWLDVFMQIDAVPRCDEIRGNATISEIWPDGTTHESCILGDDPLLKPGTDTPPLAITELERARNPFMPAYLGVPNVEIVEDALPEISKMDRSPLRVGILIDLRADDERIFKTIKRDLRKKMAEARRAQGIKLPRSRGKHKAGKITKAILDMWKKHKIIELAELLIWGESQATKPRKAAIGKWLFGDQENLSDRVKASEEILYEALESVPRLASTIGAIAAPRTGQYTP